MKLLSVIIPVYNIKDYLLFCIQSIALQDGDWECILVDDGSNDGSEVVCDKIAAEDSRFRVIHQENKGVNAARKRGLEEACGEYVWFVDGDDLLHPNALNVLEKYLNTRDDIYFFSELQGETPAFRTLPENIEIINYSIEKKDVLPVLNFHTVVFRRTFIMNEAFPPFLIGEDILFVMKQLARAENVVQLKQTHLYFYLIREGSAMTAPNERKLQSIINCNFEIVKFLCSDVGKCLSRFHARRFVKQLFWRNASEIQQVQRNTRKDLLKVWKNNLLALPKDILSPHEVLLQKIYRIVPIGLCCKIQACFYRLHAWRLNRKGIR